MKNDALIARLSWLIENTGINATAASERAGLAKDYIRNIQRGKARSPTVEKLRSLAEKGFGADFIWLSTGIGRPFPEKKSPPTPIISGSLPGENYRENLAFWLRDATEQADLKPSGIARRLSQQLERPFDKEVVGKMLTGSRRIAADELLAIEGITRFSAPRQIRVPLIGFITGDGELLPYGDEDLRMVEAPPDATPNTTAFKVGDRYMLPVYEPETLIYFANREIAETLVDRRCIVRLWDGRLFLRTLRRGSNQALWTLQALSSYMDDITDVEIAAVYRITWIRLP